MTYEPQVDDYVIWKRPNGDWEEGWVYHKGDPIDNEKRVKQGWNPLTQYITIEVVVYPKKHCEYSSGKKMRHKNNHVCVICNKDNWNQLEYVKNRREDPLADMYKSQERPLDIDSYSSIPARY